MKIEPIDFRAVILARMEKSGINPNQLATLVEGRISRTQVYDYLRGDKRISDDKLAVILYVLRIKVKPPRSAKLKLE